MKDGIYAECRKPEVYSRRDGNFELEVPVSFVSETYPQMCLGAEGGYLEFDVQNEERLEQIPRVFKRAG